MMKPIRITVRPEKGVRPAITRFIRGDCRLWQEILSWQYPKFRWKLGVGIVNADSVGCPDGIGCRGIFFHGFGEPYISLAADTYKKDGFSGDEELSLLRECLAHEIAHFCQFLDGASISERGVKVRTRNLLNLFAWSDDHKENQNAS